MTRAQLGLIWGLVGGVAALQVVLWAIAGSLDARVISIWLIAGWIRDRRSRGAGVAGDRHAQRAAGRA